MKAPKLTLKERFWVYHRNGTGVFRAVYLSLTHYGAMRLRGMERG